MAPRCLTVLAPIRLGEEDALRAVLREEPTVEIVGESTSDPVDVLVAIGQTAADVLIHSWGQDEHLQATQSHMFAEFPDLLIVGVCLKEESGYAQCQIGNIESLFSFLRTTRKCA